MSAIVTYAYEILAVLLLLVVAAVAIWFYMGHKAAQLNKVFQPLPQSPESHDATYIAQRLQELEESPPSFLRRQAD